MWLFLILVLGSTPLNAEHSFFDTGYSFDESVRIPSLPKGGAQSSFPLSGIDRVSQKYIDHALDYMHGFWTYEAERLLRVVIKKYPNHPMPKILNALNHQIFLSGDFARGKSYLDRALKDAKKTKLTRRENLYISAVKALYSEKAPKDQEDEAKDAVSLDHLAELMTIVEEFPNDLEAKSFLALGLWMNLNSSGEKDLRVRDQADELIQAVLEKKPGHPVHHYKIHLFNDDDSEFEALSSAREVGPFHPRVAHLWHMPAHIFYKTQNLIEALRHFRIAHRLDVKAMNDLQIMPIQIHNFIHNFRDYGFKIEAQAGSFQKARRTAKDIIKTGRLPSASARYSMQKLALEFSRVSEEYRAWDDFQQDFFDGFYNLQETGNEEDDVLFNSRIIRRLIRAEVETKNDADKLNAYFKTLETISKKIEDSEDLKVVKADAKLWFEIGLRKRTNSPIELYFFEKLSQNELTPKSHVMVLAQSFGHPAYAEELFKDLFKRYFTRGIVPLMDMLWMLAVNPDLAKHSQRTVEKFRIEIRTLVAKMITDEPEDTFFENFPLTQDYRYYKKLLVEEALAFQREYFSAIPREFEYLYKTSVEDYGPQSFFFNPINGANITTRDLMKLIPEATKFKLVLFAVGPSCPACLKQINKIREKIQKFKDINIEVVVVSQTNEAFDNLETIDDSSLVIHKAFDAFDQFDQTPRHGVILLDENLVPLYKSITPHAQDDIDFMLDEFARLIDLKDR